MSEERLRHQLEVQSVQIEEVFTEASDSIAG